MKAPVRDIRTECLLEPGNLIIIESTIPVGTSEKIGGILAKLPPELSLPQLGGNGSYEKDEQIYLAQSNRNGRPEYEYQMKAIILVTGIARRLYTHTRDIRMCLLGVGGRTILEHQLSAFGASRDSGCGTGSSIMAYQVVYYGLPGPVKYVHRRWQLGR